MTLRTISVIAGILAACTTIYYLRPALLHETQPKMHRADHTPSTDHLLIALSTSARDRPRTIRISIHNKRAEGPLTFLAWDTPLDSSALNTGVLLMTDEASGGIVPGPELKLNRMMPPPRDALVTISPGESVQKDIELSAPWIPRHGRLVRISARGSWRAVWTKSQEDIRDDELSAMAGEGIMTGSFESVEDALIEL